MGRPWAGAAQRLRSRDWEGRHWVSVDYQLSLIIAVFWRSCSGREFLFQNSKALVRGTRTRPGALARRLPVAHASRDSDAACSLISYCRMSSGLLQDEQQLIAGRAAAYCRTSSGLLQDEQRPPSPQQIAVRQAETQDRGRFQVPAQPSPAQPSPSSLTCRPRPRCAGQS